MREGEFNRYRVGTVCFPLRSCTGSVSLDKSGFLGDNSKRVAKSPAQIKFVDRLLYGFTYMKNCSGKVELRKLTLV